MSSYILSIGVILVFPPLLFGAILGAFQALPRTSTSYRTRGALGYPIRWTIRSLRAAEGGDEDAVLGLILADLALATPLNLLLFSAGPALIPALVIAGCAIAWWF
jgi:hypothetical protein